MLIGFLLVYLIMAVIRKHDLSAGSDVLYPGGSYRSILALAFVNAKGIFAIVGLTAFMGLVAKTES